jgi:hypothetical protein
MSVGGPHVVWRTHVGRWAHVVWEAVGWLGLPCIHPTGHVALKVVSTNPSGPLSPSGTCEHNRCNVPDRGEDLCRASQRWGVCDGHH